MKKYFQSITDVNLFQQLSIIIFSFAFFVVVFFSIYLRGNINDFVDTQVISLLRASQATIAAREEGHSSGTSELSADAQVIHFVLNRGTFVRFYGYEYEPQLLEDVIELAGTLEESWSEGVGTLAGNSYYYRILQLDNNRIIISLIKESYGNNIENTLLSGVSNTTAIAVSIMFIIIMIWTFSIITPLQQIRFYIDKVRKGEEATLNIDRKDEIGELAKELVSLREELKHQEETKEEMVHNISHDLKTPIATIKSYAESIKDGIYPYDTLEKSVDVIIDNADRLEQKVYSLLFLNRLDYMMEQEMETDKTTDMKETVEKVLLSLKAIRTEVTIDPQLEPAQFKGDDESWRIVVENLLDNSLRYAVSNITIRLKPGELTISNDGPPISNERMARLFKPFEKGTRGKFGLGLSICYKVCQAYRYTIDAENLENGVVFRIKEKPAKKERKRLSRVSDEPVKN